MATAECPNCGSPLEPGWRFCQGCGRAVAEPPVEEAVASGQPKGPRVAARLFRWRRLLGAAAVVALLSGLAFAVSEEVSTHHDLRDTRENLATTRASLTKTAATLKRTRADLERRTSERDGARRSFASTQQQLDGVRQSLSDSEQQVDVQAGHIQTLRTCLDGIIDALVYSSEDNFDAAIGALNAVETACTDAESLL